MDIVVKPIIKLSISHSNLMFWLHVSILLK